MEQRPTPDEPAAAVLSDLTDSLLFAINAALSRAACRHCGKTGTVRAELRPVVVAHPLDSHPLAGQIFKVSGYETVWPWAVSCRSDLGGCGQESKGQLRSDAQQDEGGSRPDGDGTAR